MINEKGFFDSYPEFYKTSRTNSAPNRLNSRYLALISSNTDIIRDCSILDLASHDGRWSFAAIKNGASKVMGIEARKELVEGSIENMKKYQVDEKKYLFIHGDVIDEIKTIQPNTIDTVFCFGYFYHTLNHFILLSEIRRIKPKSLILDTGISAFKESVIEVIEEDSEDPRMAVKCYDNRYVLTGMPSKSALELMLRNMGFSFQYYNWNDGKIQNWYDIEEYRTGGRVSLVAKSLS